MSLSYATIEAKFNNEITNTLKRALKLGIPEPVITPSPFNVTIFFDSLINSNFVFSKN